MNNYLFHLKLARNAEGAPSGPGATAEGSAALSAAPTSSQPSNADAGNPPPNGAQGAEGTPGGQGGEAPSTAPETKTEAPAPLTIADIKVPEGFQVSETEIAPFLEVMSKDLAPKERAEALLDLYAKQQEASLSAIAQSWEQTQNEWREAVKALPEFSKNVEAELGSVKQALKSIGAGDEFFKALDLTGAGNNPHVLQVLHKLTRPYVEGGAVGGSVQTSPRSLAERMYPTMAKG